MAAQSANTGEQIAKRADNHEEEGLRLERRATAAAERQAFVAAEADRWARRNYRISIAQAAATILSVVFTAGAALAAASAARSAHKATVAIPILERAYPYVVIKGDNAERALDIGARSSPVVSRGGRATVDFVIKNYGKTPATILDIFAEIYVAGDGDVHDVKGDFFPAEPMLGEQDTTEPFCAEMTRDLYADDFFAIHNGSLQLTFVGWVNYRDVWDNKRCVQFGWAYNPVYKKWMPRDSSNPQHRQIT